MKYYKQAEQMYVYEKQPFDAIDTKLIFHVKLCFIGKRNMSGIEKDLRRNAIKKILAANFLNLQKN